MRNSQHSSSSFEHGSCLSMFRHPRSRHIWTPLLFVHCVYQKCWNRVAYYRNLQDLISSEPLATDRHTASKERIKTGYPEFNPGMLLLLLVSVSSLVVLWSVVISHMRKKIVRRIPKVLAAAWGRWNFFLKLMELMWWVATPNYVNKEILLMWLFSDFLYL